MFNDELYHDGTKGMRWGIRRYQNKDGSLTEEGKLRYRRLSEKNEIKKIKAETKRIKAEERRDKKRIQEEARSKKNMEKFLNKQEMKKIKNLNKISRNKQNAEAFLNSFFRKYGENAANMLDIYKWADWSNQRMALKNAKRDSKLNVKKWKSGYTQDLFNKSVYDSETNRINALNSIGLNYRNVDQESQREIMNYLRRSGYNV